MPPLTKKQEAAVARLGQEKNHSSQWKIVETYYWEQIFPAGRQIEVQHEYSPKVGSTYNEFTYQDGTLAEDELPRAYNGLSSDTDPKEACVDEPLRQTFNKRAKFLGEGRDAVKIFASIHDVEYILGTGRNWKGPIEQFTLKIKKESPDQLVSLCFPGHPKKIDPVTLEFNDNNFVPQDRLVIYFYNISSNYQITPKTLAAATPPSVIIPYTSSNIGGASVIALGATNDDISEFMRKLKLAGAPNVNLLQLRKVEACGTHLLRADLKIEGDSSALRYSPKVPESANIIIPVNSQRVSCKVRLGQH